MAIAPSVISPHTFWSVLLGVALQEELRGGCGRMATSATTAELGGWSLLSTTPNDRLGQEGVLVRQLVAFEGQLVHAHQVTPRHDVVPNQLRHVIADEPRFNAAAAAALAHLRLLLQPIDCVASA